MNRRGYTLVEMLIALVLVVTLMSAAWGLTSLYNRFLTAGRAQALDQQIARSLFQLIDEDIGLVSLPVQPRQIRAEPNVDHQNSGASSSVDIDSGRPSESAGGDMGLFSGFMNDLADQNLNLPPLEFTGTATELRMTLISPVDSRPIQVVSGLSPMPSRSVSVRASMSDEQSELRPDASRLLTVVYQFQRPGMTSDFDQQLAAGLHRIEISALQLRQLTGSARFEQTASSDRQVTNSGQGLGSQEINRFTLEALLTSHAATEQVDEAESIPEFRHEHIAEVVHFEFEYFDGARWISSWSSDALPTAVRVRFGVVSQDELKTIAGVFADATSQMQSAAAPSDSVDPLAAIKPRRFERILLLASEDTPEADFGDEFTGAIP